MTRDTQTDIYILAGQSNMAGGGTSDELPAPLRTALQAVRLFQDGAFTDLLRGPRFGPEVGFAHAVAAACPDRRTVLCKVARGGANLNYDWNPDGVSRGDEDDYRGPLYPVLLSALADLRQRLTQEGRAHRLAGMLWMQGERDSVFESMASAYERNLRQFIDAIRRDSDAPRLPFVIGLVCPRVVRVDAGGTAIRTHAFRDTVRTAQRAVAADMPDASIVDTDDLPVCDNLHFDTAGQWLLGQRFAQQLVRP